MDSFELWWKENQGLYGLVGVKKEVAKSIWIDACNSVSRGILNL